MDHVLGHVKLLLENLSSDLQPLNGKRDLLAVALALMTAAYIAVIFRRRVLPGWPMLSMILLASLENPVMSLSPDLADSVDRVEVLNDELCHVPGDVRIDDQSQSVENRREITSDLTGDINNRLDLKSILAVVRRDPELDVEHLILRGRVVVVLVAAVPALVLVGLVLPDSAAEGLGVSASEHPEGLVGLELVVVDYPGLVSEALL